MVCVYIYAQGELVTIRLSLSLFFLKEQPQNQVNDHNSRIIQDRRIDGV